MDELTKAHIASLQALHYALSVAYAQTAYSDIETANHVLKRINEVQAEISALNKNAKATAAGRGMNLVCAHCGGDKLEDNEDRNWEDEESCEGTHICSDCGKVTLACYEVVLVRLEQYDD